MAKTYRAKEHYVEQLNDNVPNGAFWFTIAYCEIKADAERIAEALNTASQHKK